MKKNIKLIDNAFSHEEYCGSKIGRNYSEKIIWERTHEIKENDIVFLTDSSLPFINSISSRCVKIALLLEPPCVYSFSYDFIKENHSKFDFIITHQDFLSIFPNVIILPQWCTWIYPEKQNLYKKNKVISIIASNKKDTDGQRLRHEIIESYRDKTNIDIFGGLTSGNIGYKPIIDKSEGLSDYAFSIVIENSKSNFYFTEKLIDCFVTGTIPIYWGCNRVENFFDKRGFFTFEKIEDLENILPNLNIETYNKNSIDINTFFEYFSSLFSLSFSM